ncbi:hypothetical protein HK102_010641, partial [Quaeritorhiza haematococci]
ALSADRVKAEKVAKGPADTNTARSASIGLTAAEEALIALDLQDRIKEVGKHVKKLNADRAIDRQSWIEVGMAIHHATDGQGMEIWDEFSRRAGPYDRDVLKTQWDSFKNGSGITIGSLIHWGKQDAKAARDEKKERKAEEEKTKADDVLRREAVKFGVDHTGGKGVFESWDDPENLVAVIKNTMHHPDHRVECVFSSEGALLARFTGVFASGPFLFVPFTFSTFTLSADNACFKYASRTRRYSLDPRVRTLTNQSGASKSLSALSIKEKPSTNLYSRRPSGDSNDDGGTKRKSPCPRMSKSS